MDIKAIFLDVDGTLVSFDTHRVPSSAVEALRQVHQTGVKIIISTGRSATDLQELSEIPYDAIVALNGADCVLKNGMPVAQNGIDLENFLKVQSLAQQYGCPLAVETNQGIFVNELTPRVIEMAKLVNHDIPQVADIELVFREQACCQLCIYCDDTVEKLIMSQLTELESSRWNSLLADINPAGVDKALGVHTFCAYYGFEESQTMAFGDGGNDIAMLQAAGIGIAMGGADEEVKASADYVTESVDNHGIRNALASFFNLKEVSSTN